LVALIGIVGTTFAAGAWFSQYKLWHDPHIIMDSEKDPYPYLRIRSHDKIAKFYAVSQKTEQDDEEQADLFDILNGKYGDT